MRRFTAILLVFALAFQCLLKLGITAWYEANKTYIAQNLCKNRDKPELKCCGKCYLKKQLRKAGESSEKSNLPTKQQKQERVEFLLAFNTLQLPAVIFTPVADFPLAKTPECLSGVPASIFHPPSLG